MISRASSNFLSPEMTPKRYAFGTWLPYLKGGYAGANLKSSMFDTSGDTLSNSQWRNGWDLGAGVEYALAPIDFGLMAEVLSLLRPIHNHNYTRGRPENRDPILA